MGQINTNLLYMWIVTAPGCGSEQVWSGTREPTHPTAGLPEGQVLDMFNLRLYYFKMQIFPKATAEKGLNLLF